MALEIRLSFDLVVPPNRERVPTSSSLPIVDDGLVERQRARCGLELWEAEPEESMHLLQSKGGMQLAAQGASFFSLRSS